MKNAIKILIFNFSIERNSLMVFLFAFLFGNLSINAQTTNVSSVSALQTAINSSSSGVTITLADGTYTNASITISKSGIAIKALNSGGVIFNGNSKCTISGNSNIFSGFQYLIGNVNASNIIEGLGNYNTITQCNFYGVVAHNYVHFDKLGHNNTVSYSNFEVKPANPDGSPLVPGCDKNTASFGNAGPAIQVNISASIISFTTISHCSFMNFIGNGGDFGNEVIRIGLTSEAANTSASVVEFCYFENTGPGDSEAISLKSYHNVVRFHTNNSNPNASFVLRNGGYYRVYSHFFMNSGGIRRKQGTNHMIYNNYFRDSSNQSFLNLMNYNVDPLDVIYVYHNTFYNPSIIEFGASGPDKPTNVKFVNNIIYKNSGSIISDNNTNVSFTNNFYFGGASLGITTSGFTATDFKLALNSYDYYSLLPRSPAIDASNGTYADIVVNLN